MFTLFTHSKRSSSLRWSPVVAIFALHCGGKTIPLHDQYDDGSDGSAGSSAGASAGQAGANTGHGASHGHAGGNSHGMGGGENFGGSGGFGGTNGHVGNEGGSFGYAGTSAPGGTGGYDYGTGGIGATTPGNECSAGEQQDCSCTNGTVGTQTCKPDSYWSTCLCEGSANSLLGWYQNGMLGYWEGTVKNPAGKYDVGVEFRDTGIYVGDCNDPYQGTVTYFGMCLQTELNTYTLFDINESNEGVGFIASVWQYPPEEPYNLLEQLQHLTLSPDLMQLKFQVIRHDSDDNSDYTSSVDLHRVLKP